MLIPATQLPTRPQLAQTSVQIGTAFAQSGAIVEDQGPNRSDILDKYEAVWGLQGVSYCEIGHWIPRLKALCFDLFPGQTIDVALLRRARVIHEQNYGPCLTGCTDTIAAYTPRKRWRPLDHSQTLAWIKALRGGDGVIYDFSTPGNFDRHFETYKEMLRDAQGNLARNDDGLYVMITIGWNTMPDAASGSQSDGQGCYIRHRAVNHTVMGSLDENTEKP